MRRWIGAVAVLGAALAAVILPARSGLAWGPEAHRVIALFADRLLQQSDPAARAKIQALLATDKGGLTKNDIASEALWADVLRQKSEEARDATSPWHSARLNADNPNLASACFGRTPLPEGYPASHGPRENCSVDKILQFEAELKNPQTSQGERLAAVKFLLNLVGDLHDPLYAIDHGDQGGNCTAVEIATKQPARLAEYWGAALPAEIVGANPAAGAARLAAAVSPADAQKWAEGAPEDWLQETYQIAKTLTYGFGEQAAGKYVFPARHGETEICSDIKLYRAGPDYETKALAAARTQLARAAVRLARLLRDGFK